MASLGEAGIEVGLKCKIRGVGVSYGKGDFDVLDFRGVRRKHLGLRYRVCERGRDRELRSALNVKLGELGLYMRRKILANA